MLRNTGQNGNTNGNQAGGTAVPYQQVIEDDGTSVWASPTEGAPFTLKDVPPNAQIYLLARLLK